MKDLEADLTTTRGGLTNILQTVYTLIGSVDFGKLSTLLLAAQKLTTIDISTKEGLKAAVEAALGVVVALTDATTTIKDDLLGSMAKTLLARTELISGLADLIAPLLGSKSRALAPLEVHEFASARSLDPTTIMSIVQMIMQIIAMFRKKA